LAGVAIACRCCVIYACFHCRQLFSAAVMLLMLLVLVHGELVMM